LFAEQNPLAFSGPPLHADWCCYPWVINKGGEFYHAGAAGWQHKLPAQVSQDCRCFTPLYYRLASNLAGA
jgi:hypothetical protein